MNLTQPTAAFWLQSQNKCTFCIQKVGNTDCHILRQMDKNIEDQFVRDSDVIILHNWEVESYYSDQLHPSLVCDASKVWQRHLQLRLCHHHPIHWRGLQYQHHPHLPASGRGGCPWEQVGHYNPVSQLQEVTGEGTLPHFTVECTNTSIGRDLA